MTAAVTCVSLWMVDRLLLAAIVDRLVFGADTTFDPSDALELARLLPRHARTSFLGQFLGLGLDASISGGCKAATGISSGFAC